MKPESIRMSEETIRWLKRNGKPLSQQLREDLRTLQLLKDMQAEGVEIPLARALQMAEKII